MDAPYTESRVNVPARPRRARVLAIFTPGELNRFGATLTTRAERLRFQARHGLTTLERMAWQSPLPALILAIAVGFVVGYDLRRALASRADRR